MAIHDETRRVVENFFAAWTSRNAREARALLADDLEYSGPLNSYRSADELLPPLMKFAAMLHGARVVDLIVERNKAALLYDCELSAPVGTLRTASFQRVEGGKIREYRQAFDATELRRVLAPPTDWR
jgi:ketosteroid isomerase-like protein